MDKNVKTKMFPKNVRDMQVTPKGKYFTYVYN